MLIGGLLFDLPIEVAEPRSPERLLLSLADLRLGRVGGAQ